MSTGQYAYLPKTDATIRGLIFDFDYKMACSRCANTKIIHFINTCAITLNWIFFLLNTEKKTSTTHRISSFQFVDAQCTRLRYKNVINVPKSSLSERNNQPPNQKYHLFSTFSTLAQSVLDNCLNISYPPNIKPSQIVLLTNSAYVNHYKEDKSYENV